MMYYRVKPSWPYNVLTHESDVELIKSKIHSVYNGFSTYEEALSVSLNLKIEFFYIRMDFHSDKNKPKFRRKISSYKKQSNKIKEEYPELFI